MSESRELAACPQVLLASFVRQVSDMIIRLEGKTEVRPGIDTGQFLLVNETLERVADTLQLDGLLSPSDAYAIVVGILNSQDLLPNPLDVLEDIVRVAKFQDTEKHKADDNTYTRLIYLCQVQAEKFRSQDRLSDAGDIFSRLIRAFTDSVGHLATPTLQARNRMEEFATHMVQTVTSSSQPEHHKREHVQPFRLHVATSRGRISQVLDALVAGIGVKTFNAEREMPINVAIKHGYADILRLLLFYGAEVDREILTFAIDDRGNGRYPNGAEIVRILVLNLRDQKSVLLEACEKGYGMVELLLDMGIETVSQESTGYMPLHLAAMNGHLEIVRTLLIRKAKVHASSVEGQKPIHLAALNGHEEVVELLLDFDADAGDWDGRKQTPMHLAASNGHLGIVKILVAAGADPNAAEDEKRLTPLHMAADNNHADVIRWLLTSGGANPDARAGYMEPGGRNVQEKYTALHVAATRGHSDATTALCQAGSAALYAHDKWGQTPLIIVSREDRTQTLARIMLEYGADALAQEDSGRSSLEYAAWSGFEVTAELLIQKGAPLDNVDGFGRMALHYAAMHNRKNVAEILINKQVNIDATDKDGWTPLHYACSTESVEVANLLVAKGADTEKKDRLGHVPAFYSTGKLDVNFWTRALPPPYPET
ncbi:ankyrin repeat-containing domain protein [Cercophora samala]|uniref:Ankyrin repeat-containing domain protein n=1 Tax=Cercophora samala TaxID=330535 RepID=A0AA40D705_9PEZI|nr:ankyrin repeat-containing domain protein [Cercophora samala]